MKFGGRCVSRPKPTKHWWKMKTARVRIIKHETVPGCGSFEVRFADGREHLHLLG